MKKKKKKVKRKLKTPQQKALGNYYKLTCMKVQEEYCTTPSAALAAAVATLSALTNMLESKFLRPCIF